MSKIPFVPADILLPAPGTDMEKWAVVACDQFTSQPEYWKQLERFIGDAPSALRITLPEIYLGDRDDDRIAAINSTMERYLAQGLFREYPNAMIYLERTLPDGKIRRGLIGAIDLEAYDFRPEKKALIRATEGTVLSRIPPRVRIRRSAPMELPHVMLLADDPGRTIIEPLSGRKGLPLYDFPLSMGGGHLRGWLLDRAQQDAVLAAMTALRGEEESPLLFAVGDGNHSLATAKACYEENPNPLNRYALVELVNIHDEALVFEPIYRVLFHVDADDLRRVLTQTLCQGDTVSEMLAPDFTQPFYTDGFAVGPLQALLDAYVSDHPDVQIDYVHGEEVARRLGQQEGCCAFLFDGMSKSELFPIVRRDGVLPRKSFSMGEAAGKRYYVEARKIR